MKPGPIGREEIAARVAAVKAMGGAAMKPGPIGREEILYGRGLNAPNTKPQ